MGSTGFRGHFSILRSATLAAVISLVAAINLTAAISSAAEFRAGRSAFNLGEYARAIAIWMPLARNGDPKSQASLGYIYLMGLGVNRDPAEAARWYGEAARQGQPDALYYVGILSLDGRGVARDYSWAYVACSLALQKGIARGLSCQDMAASVMTDDEIKRANRRVSEFMAREYGD